MSITENILARAPDPPILEVVILLGGAVRHGLDLSNQACELYDRPPSDSTTQLRDEATERFDDTAQGRGHRPRPTQPTLSTLGPAKLASFMSTTK